MSRACCSSDLIPMHREVWYDLHIKDRKIYFEMDLVSDSTLQHVQVQGTYKPAFSKHQNKLLYREDRLACSCVILDATTSHPSTVLLPSWLLSIAEYREENVFFSCIPKILKQVSVIWAIFIFFETVICKFFSKAEKNILEKARHSMQAQTRRYKTICQC